MQFKWNSPSSQLAFITMTTARVRCKGIDIDRAISETLHKGNHCQNPELISDETIRRLRREVVDKLRSIKKSLPAASGK